MLWQTNPYSLPIFGATIVAAIMAVVVWRRRPALGASALSLMCAAVAAWGLAYGLYWAAPTPALQFQALNAIAIGAGLAPVALLGFVLQLTGRRRWLTRPVVLTMAGIYLASLLAAFTDPWTHVWYVQVSAVTLHGLSAIAFTPTWLYWILADVYGYLLAAAAVGLLLREQWLARGIYRMQYGLILAAITISFGASLVSDFGWTPWPDLNLTPLAFAVSEPILAYALFRFRLLDLVPIARSVLVDRMTDAIIVLDRQHRILDINTAALKMLGWTGPAPLGQPAQRVLAVWPDLMARYADVFDASADIQSGADRTLELLITPLRHPNGELSGRLIVLRDVTLQRRTEQALQVANTHLRSQLVEIEQLQAQLREQAIRDPLTGLFNRRYLEEYLQMELARARRARQPVSIVFIDLDHFKRVNDTYGHDAGDRVLQALAQHLVLNSRASTLVCRYGGEEIVIILTEAAAEGAAQRAEQWRSGIAQLRIAAGDHSLLVTISAGVASYPLDGGTMADVMRAADAALYQAKSDGRNCGRRRPWRRTRRRG